MVKRITPDDVQTNIGYKQPEVTWQGKISLDHGFYAERGNSIVSDYYRSIFDAVSAYPDGIINDGAIAELTEGEKRMLAKPSTNVSKASAENLVILSEKFHTHPSYDDFYEQYKNAISGFMGCYSIVIDMAEIMTNWEEKQGGNELYDSTEVIWDDLAQSFVDKYFEVSLRNHDGITPDEATVFKTVIPKKDGARRQPQRIAGIISPDVLKP